MTAYRFPFRSMSVRATNYDELCPIISIHPNKYEHEYRPHAYMASCDAANFVYVLFNPGLRLIGRKRLGHLARAHKYGFCDYSPPRGIELFQKVTSPRLLRELVPVPAVCVTFPKT